MPNLNRCFLMGNVTKDPELSYTPKGTSVALLSLALNRTLVDDAGAKRQETTFVDVRLWARLAEIAAQYLRKGHPVFVEGRLHLNTWEQNGQKRSTLVIVGENLQFLARREGTGAAPAAPPPRPASVAPQRSQTAPVSKAAFVEPNLDVPDVDDPF